MSRKKEEEKEEGGSERWLVSYSDFITLLMVMFVVLYSLGQVDVKKYQLLATAMQAAFSLGGPVKVVDSKINQSSGQDSTGSSNPIVIPGIPKTPSTDVEVAGQLTEMLQKYQLGASVSVQTNIEGVLISLSEKLVFTPGTAELKSEAYPVLDSIITMLTPIDNPVRIVGHTDTTPPIDPKYADNWELSSGRAIVIANYMVKKGIAPDRLSVLGDSQYQPVFPNDTAEHRALNSRADIVIIYKTSTSVLTSNTSSSTQTAPTTAPTKTQGSGGNP